MWTVRYFVPKPLQAVAGRAEIWRSTGTAILREAETKQHENLVLYNARHTFATALENAGIAPSVITTPRPDAEGAGVVDL